MKLDAKTPDAKSQPLYQMLKLENSYATTEKMNPMKNKIEHLDLSFIIAFILIGK